MKRYVYITRQGGLALSRACGFTLSACREVELQPTDFMDLIFRILTTSDSGPSITPKLSSVTPCGFSCSFLPAALLPLFPLTKAHMLSPFILFSLALALALLSPHLVFLTVLCLVELQAVA